MTVSERVVVTRLMPKALWWFRWSSVVTVLAGIAYWNHIVVNDAKHAIAAGEPRPPDASLAASL